MPPWSQDIVDEEDRSEVEVLSPYLTGATPTMPGSHPSMVVKRSRPVRRSVLLRALAIGLGAFLVTTLGIGVGVLVVVLSGLRSI